MSDDEVLEFGVSGMLYRNGMIMYDRQTDSLWSHILGQAISGDYEGTQLTFIPALQTDWQSWKALHPNTLIVNPRRIGFDNYANYYRGSQEGVLGWENPDETLRAKEYLIGVRVAEKEKAYPFSKLNDEPVVNDTIEDIHLVIFFDKASASGTVFERQLEDGRILTFETSSEPRKAIDLETESQWNILTGTAEKGPLAGTRLTQVPITYAFWFGWVDYHPESTIYGYERP